MARFALQTGHLVNAVADTQSATGIFYYPSAFMPPFYTFLWMGAFAVFGVTKTALAFMTVLNVVMGAAIVCYAMRIARTLFGSARVAALAGIVIALQPVFIFSVVTYHSLNLYILLLLAIFDLTASDKRHTYARAALAGLLTGIAVLVRTEYLVLAGAILLGALLHHRQWRKTAVAAAIALAVVLPWTARNYVVLHHFIPVANSTGYNLFKGFNPEANGSGHWVDAHHVARRLLGSETNAVPKDANYENAKDAIYKRAAIAYIEAHPVRSFVELPLIKVALFWTFDVYEAKTLTPLYQLQFWPLFLFSVFGLYAAARRGYFSRPDHKTILVLFAFQTLVMMGYAVHARYRMNMEPFLYAYASFGFIQFAAWLRRRKTPPLPATPQ